MGLLSALAGKGPGEFGGTGGLGVLLPLLFGEQGQQSQAPQMPPPSQPGMSPMSNNEFGNAFANNPQFMQQLQAMQNGQGPGRQMPQFTPPPMQMSTSVPQQPRNGAQGAMTYPFSMMRNQF